MQDSLQSTDRRKTERIWKPVPSNEVCLVQFAAAPFLWLQAAVLGPLDIDTETNSLGETAVMSQTRMTFVDLANMGRLAHVQHVSVEKRQSRHGIQKVAVYRRPQRLPCVGRGWPNERRPAPRAVVGKGEST